MDPLLGQAHQWIGFGNRMLGIAVVVSILVFGVGLAVGAAARDGRG